MYKQILINAKLQTGKRGKKNRSDYDKFIKQVKDGSGLYCHRRRRRRRRSRRRGRRRFIIMFTTACHLSLSEARIKTNTIPSYIFKILFNIILPPTSSLPYGLYFRVLNQNLVGISLLSHTCHMPCIPYPQFCHPGIM